MASLSRCLLGKSCLGSGWGLGWVIPGSRFTGWSEEEVTFLPSLSQQHWSYEFNSQVQTPLTVARWGVSGGFSGAQNGPRTAFSRGKASGHLDLADPLGVCNACSRAPESWALCQTARGGASAFPSPGWQLGMLPDQRQP